MQHRRLQVWVGNQTRRTESQDKMTLHKAPVGYRFMLVAESPPVTLFFTRLELISVHSLCSWQNKFQLHASKFSSVAVYLISAHILIQS